MYDPYFWLSSPGYSEQKNRRTMQSTMKVEILWTAAQLYKKILFQKACSMWITWKITQGS